MWIDGQEIGVTAGSRLTQEFDVTDALTAADAPGEHRLDVRAVQWSVNTYVEDQDMWWASGTLPQRGPAAAAGWRHP